MRCRQVCRFHGGKLRSFLFDSFCILEGETGESSAEREKSWRKPSLSRKLATELGREGAPVEQRAPGKARRGKFMVPQATGREPCPAVILPAQPVRIQPPAKAGWTSKACLNPGRPTVQAARFSTAIVSKSPG